MSFECGRVVLRVLLVNEADSKCVKKPVNQKFMIRAAI